MILFLDVVSPLPEFTLIEDNKIIYSQDILSNENDKMSDTLIPAYLRIEKKFNLDSQLKNLIVNTGPGSYTALRVGIAFFSSLSLSKNLALNGVSCIDLFKLTMSDKDLTKSAIYISSSNDQNFIYFYNSDENKFKIKKIEKNLELDKQGIDLSLINKVYTNGNIKKNNKKLFNDIEIKVIKFSNIVNVNIKQIVNLNNNKIIEPIYFSNNKILN